MNTKRKLHIWISVIVTLVMIMDISGSYAVRATNSDTIQVYVDGVKVNFDVPPMIIEGRTMVPMRAIFEAIGAEVTWDQERQLVIGIKDDTIVELYIGSVLPTVNNEIKQINVPATVVNKRTLAPLRFVGEAFGGTVTWDGLTRTVNIYTTNVTNNQVVKTLTDFEILAGEISFVEDAHQTTGFVRPGTTIKITIPVHKISETTSGGGHLVLTFDGNKIDEVPFFMDVSDNTKTIVKKYQLPFGRFEGFNEDESTMVPFTVTLLEDAATKDIVSANNEATVQVEVHGVERLTNNVISDAQLVSIKTFGDFGSGLAKAGEYLTLKANIKGSGKKTLVYFYINGQLIDEKTANPPASGSTTTISTHYYVPYENSGVIDYRVILDSGAEAFIPIVIEPFEYEAISDGISWNPKSATVNYEPGESLYLKAKVLRKNLYSFSESLRVYFEINGVLSPALKVDPPSGTIPYMGDINYTYQVASDQTGPLSVKLLVDPGCLYQEEREDNNVATVVVPERVEGTAGNDIEVSGIRYSPNNAVPGEKVQLIVTVKNNSKNHPSKTVPLVFKINGQALTGPATGNQGTISSSYLEPGQTYVASRMWTVPSGLSGDFAYSVEIDPGGVLTGDNQSDNAQTIELPLARPELGVELNSLTSSENLVSGFTGQLKGRIYNNGSVGAEGVTVAFYLNDVEIGQKTVDLPKHASMDVMLPWSIPTMQSTNDTLGMYGATGYNDPPPEKITYSYTLKIDPENVIMEGDETNNIGGPKNIDISILSKNGRVYAKIYSIQNETVEGAMVVLASGATSATAMTDSYGYATFFNVPYGAYELNVSKTGFINGTTTDEELVIGNLSDYARVYLDNRSTLTGTITNSSGSVLENAEIHVKGTSQNTITGANGTYSIRLFTGQYTLVYTKAGYQYKEESITAGGAAQISSDITLETTDKAYLSGFVYNASGAKLPNQSIVITTIGGQELATVTSDASGKYSATIILSTLESWVYVTASHGGVDRQGNVYLTQGYEQDYDISFEPLKAPVDTDVQLAKTIMPWVVCAEMPGTFANPSYKVEAIYGMFDFSVEAVVDNSFITSLNIDSEPNYWIHSSVSSTWSPLSIVGAGALKVISFVGDALDLYRVSPYKGDTYLNQAQIECVTYVRDTTVSVISKLSVPLAMNMHSTNYTKVWIKKIAIMSNGLEVDALYPDAIEDKSWSPNALANWPTAQIKFYLKTDTSNGMANPAAGYNYDRVLIVWDLATNSFVKIGNYQVIGWDENIAREIYMDE